jgi:hypothetical protein
MFALHLASKLIVAIFCLLDVRLSDQRFATPPQAFHAPVDLDLRDAEEPEATRRALVGAQAVFGFHFLLDVFHTRLFAIVFMIGALIVSGIICKVLCPVPRIIRQLFLPVFTPIRLQDCKDAAILVALEKVRVWSIRWCI